VRDERFFVNKARLLLKNAALMAPIIPLLGIIYSQTGNKTFPALGKKSQKGVSKIKIHNTFL
jgi:hypothetical protein